jgi:hypothetical protein
MSRARGEVLAALSWCARPTGEDTIGDVQAAGMGYFTHLLPGTYIRRTPVGEDWEPEPTGASKLIVL